MIQVLLTIFCLIVGSIQAQIVLSDNALQLAARRVEHRQVDIPQEEAQNIELALRAIAESQEAKALEMQSYNIQAFPQISLYRLDLFLDANSPIGQAYLQNQEAQTQLSDYLEPYGLRVAHREQRGDLLLLAIETEEALNMRFLANELSMNMHVLMVQMPVPKYKYSDIRLRKLNGEDLLIHYQVFLDESADESNCHVWEFVYSSTGQIKFLAEYGPDMPSSAVLQGQDKALDKS